MLLSQLAQNASSLIFPISVSRSRVICAGV